MGENKLAGLAATKAELGYVHGVVSTIQTQLDAKTAGPASATTGNLVAFADTSGKVLQDGGAPRDETKLPLAGGAMSGSINMANHDLALVKLLTLYGEIDDLAGALSINWNSGAAHKVTLGANTTLTFAGLGSSQIPHMTLNTAPSGVVTVQESGCDTPNWAYKFFIQGAQQVNALYANKWVKYAFPVGIAKMAAAFTVQFYSGWAPATFKLEASNDDSNWTQLINATITTENLTQFTFTNAVAYRYFRWTTPGTTFPSELSIQEGVVNPASPCFLALKLVQDVAGGRTVTWPATVRGTVAVNTDASGITLAQFYWDGANYYVMSVATWTPA